VRRHRDHATATRDVHFRTTTLTRAEMTALEHALQEQPVALSQIRAQGRDGGSWTAVARLNETADTRAHETLMAWLRNRPEVAEVGEKPEQA
jgi:hypothetical protein